MAGGSSNLPATRLWESMGATRSARDVEVHPETAAAVRRCSIAFESGDDHSFVFHQGQPLAHRTEDRNASGDARPGPGRENYDPVQIEAKRVDRRGADNRI